MMAQKILPPSPNWFLSSVSAANDAGIYVYGSRGNVYAFDISAPREGLKLLGCYSGHKERVTSVALSPDGKLTRPSTNTGNQSDDGMKPMDGKATRDGTAPATALCCSGGDDTVVRIWDVSSLSDVQCHNEHKEKVTCATWSPVNTQLVASGDEKGDVILWNMHSQTGVRWRHEKDYICCLAFCPHEPALLAVGMRQGTVFLVDFSAGAGRMLHRLRGHEDEVMSVSWCPISGELFLKDSDEAQEVDKSTEGCLIATGSKDRTIRVWNRSRGRQLFYKKLPVQRRDHGDQGGRSRTWVAIHWLKDNPEHLVSSSSNGDLLMWTLKQVRGQAFKTFYTGEFRPHFRPIFNICAAGSTLCTFSQDRSLLLWDVANVEAVCSVSTLGGHCYCIRNSPVDPGRVAIGVGDNMIRVWNTASKTNPYDVTTHWQGIKNKVTAVGWHPVKEGTLGFGTEDGRVAVFDVFSQKMPVMSSTFHHRTVYVVTWGPSTTQSGNFSLFSVGDCKILEHTSAALSRADEKADAIDLTAVLLKNNPEKLENLKACEMSWNLDLNIFAVGTDEGTVYVFSGLKLLVTIRVHIKLMNCVRWHPRATDQSPSGSPCQYWLASGGNDQVLQVVNLSTAFAEIEEAKEKTILISNSLRQFPGHTERITDLSWSSFHDGRLVSVGYDAEAFVWDVQKGVALCQFRGHLGRLLTCQFSGLDPDLVMTSGSDGSVIVWRVSEQPAAKFSESKKKKKKKPADPVPSLTLEETPPTSQTADTRSSTAAGGQEESSDLHDLQQLLEDKRAELMRKEGAGSLDDVPAESDPVADGSSDPPAVTDARLPQPPIARGPRDVVSTPGAPSLKDENASDGEEDEEEEDEGRERKGPAFSARGIKSPVQAGKSVQALEGAKKKRRVKSHFPETARADNRGRAAVHDDLFLLTRLHFCGSEEGGGADVITTPVTRTASQLPADRSHLGLFTDRKGAYQCIKEEVEHHVNHDNMEYALQMEIWKGNITGAIQLARERGQISDWIVSLAPLASYECWLAVCEEYAEQLEEEGLYHKAVSYLLACHKLYPAIDLFRRHKLFREAVALAKVRLSPLDPVLEDLYTDWSEQLMRDGAYEQAAKCYLAMKHIQDAAKVIARRCDQTSLQAACHMTLLADEKHQGQLYAQQVVTRYLAARQWTQALVFLKEHQPLKVFVPYVSVHEMVLRELSTMVPDIVSAVDADVLSAWGSAATDKLGIPEFILDPKEADPVLPWDLHLVAGHAFPHHMLRIWHLHLGVTMETEQLHLVYHALQQLQSGRQAHLDTQQVLLQVCADITLWLLALLTNQTSLAISHLLAALSTLHEGGHLVLLTAICRLLLPLGPKYMLKLQQEVAALRVLINMESHVDVEGGGKHLSLRRYLSELKDEPSVSTGALRCRQLDCVRAYFYLSVLHHLQQSYATQSEDACRPEMTTTTNTVNGTSDGAGESDSLSEKLVSVSSKQSEVLSRGDQGNAANMERKQSDGVGARSGAKVQLEVRGDAGSADGGADAKQNSGSDGNGRDGDGGCMDRGNSVGSSNTSPLKEKDSVVGDGESNTDRVKTEGAPLGSPVKKTANAALSPLNQSAGNDKAKDCPGEHRRSTSEHDSAWHLSLPRLLQLSKGLLWDLQAKRLALTDTLGYIHRAISQHLLTDRSREVAKTLSRQHTLMGSVHNHNHTMALQNSHTHAPVLPDTVAAHLPNNPFLDIEDGTMVPTETEESVYTTASDLTGDTAADNHIDSENRKASSASLHSSSSSSSFSSSVPLLRTDSIDTPPSSVDSQSAVPNLEALPESNFDLDLATLGQQWDGSRRVLWEDDPLSGSGRGGEGHRVSGDGNSHKPTCLLSSAKYINVPDEWYSLPVDEKYGRSYVTLAILKDEQDFVMGELKRMSDSSQVPFPNPFNSIELLLDVSLSNTAMPTEDKHDYIKSLQSWAMHFAVTSQQRSQADNMFARAEKEIGL